MGTTRLSPKYRHFPTFVSSNLEQLSKSRRISLFYKARNFHDICMSGLWLGLSKGLCGASFGLYEDAPVHSKMEASIPRGKMFLLGNTSCRLDWCVAMRWFCYGTGVTVQWRVCTSCTGCRDDLGASLLKSASLPARKALFFSRYCTSLLQQMCSKRDAYLLKRTTNKGCCELQRKCWQGSRGRAFLSLARSAASTH